MEEEEEEARALLANGPDEAVRDAPAAPADPGALPALCDPSRLAHRLLVLLLMCFLGFGEPPGGAESQGTPDFARSPSLPLSPLLPSLSHQLLGPPSFPFASSPKTVASRRWGHSFAPVSPRGELLSPWGHGHEGSPRSSWLLLSWHFVQKEFRKLLTTPLPTAPHTKHFFESVISLLVFYKFLIFWKMN